MLINAQTRIGTLLKHQPKSLDAIISICPKFEKLRNPILRKLMAGRTSIEAASRIAGCSVEDFYIKLQPLGFQSCKEPEQEIERKALPAFLLGLKNDQVTILDVRPILDGGKDPLQLILYAVKQLETGMALKIINTFEPTPLILLLGKKGFRSYVDHVDEKQVETYFYKSAGAKEEILEETTYHSQWNECVLSFSGRLIELDVRHLEMPQPMLKILEALETLPDDKALYIYHKKIPVFLFPELQDRNFEFRFSEIDDQNVHLVIYRKKL